jgi:hypothetical protein
MTVNFPPEAVQSLAEKTVYIEPLPIIEQTVSEPYAVALDTLFTDKNLYDSLTFSVVPDGQDVCLAELSADTATLSFRQFLKHGVQRFLVTAKDQGGLTAETTYQVTVISYRQQALDALCYYGPIAAAVLAVLLFLRWLWLPSFRNMELSGFRDGRNYLAAINLKPTKRTIPLGLYADPTMLKDVGLGKEQIMSIRLKPRRHSLYVLLNKKPIGNVLVSVEDKGKTENFRRGKKKYNLRNGGEIKISNPDTNHFISWRLSIRKTGARQAQMPLKQPPRTPNMPGRR